MQPTCDVRVVGGGVAGSALAFLLHRHGLRVALVERGKARHSGPYETLLASASTLLARTGLDRLVEPCAERDGLRHGAIWGSDTIEWRAGDEAGLLLRRGAFDRQLRAVVAAAGVSVGEEAAPIGEGRPPWRAVATGRAGNTPTMPTPDEPPRTIAFTFVGEAAAGDLGTAVVEALPAGWVWTHAPQPGLASAIVFVDATMVRDRGREALLAALWSASRGPAGRLQDVRLLRATDASARLYSGPADELRLGDAAATIDPLASQGVEKALAAADHAAAVLRTAHDRPTWWSRLCAVHRRWEHGLWRAHREVAEAWYRRETRFANEPFWRQRQRPHDEVSAAAHENMPLRVASTLASASVLVREGPGFVERDGFCDTRTGDERTHIGYVPIAPLLALFREPTTIAAAVPRAGQDARLFVLPPRAVHGALAELARIGWLTAAGSAAGTR